MNASPSYIVVDKLKWVVAGDTVQPLCPIHLIGLLPIEDSYTMHVRKVNFASHTLKCEDCQKTYSIPRSIEDEKIYVIYKVTAKSIKTQQVKFINLGDEALVICENKVKQNKYFIKALLAQSKVGLRLIVYAGKTGSDRKTQIFVEPEIKRLSFDQTDLHPFDVFTKLEATFVNGSKITMENDPENR